MAGGVVRAHGGGVHAAHAAGQDLHARAVQAAQHRPAHAGAEIGGLHARQAGDGLAQGGRLGPVQRLALQHLDRPRQRLGIARQGRGGDLHGRQLGGLVGRGGQREAGAGQGEGGGQAARTGKGVTHAGCSKG